jgi:2-polyprenyl-3-methyl-5-hydroxy-6-metoxy-1,4-benzoquinol methylase
LSLPTDQYSDFPCDLCGSEDAEEIPNIANYTNGEPIHVCRNCGFVYVRRRRSAKRIAEVWSDELFGERYTARIPTIKARQVFVAEFLDTEVGLAGKTVCDIGAGEGQFLDIVRSPEYGAVPFGIEPSQKNDRTLSGLDIDRYLGTVEDFAASGDGRNFDVVTIMWTLENCESCRRMLDAAYDIVNEGGHICIATGSRLLVPFKKPLHMYLSKNPGDSHAFRFSANTLQGVLALSGFEVKFVNRFIDNDPLCMIAQKTDRSADIPWSKDDWRDVIDYFRRWDEETRQHYMA